MNTSPNTRQPQDYTLEDLAQIKADLKERIALKKDKIEELTDNLISPIQSASTGFSLLKNLKTGIAIFNGVALGIKIMRKFRQFFGGNK